MSIILQRSASLFAGDDGPDNRKAHNLDTIQLPDMEEISESAHAAASMFAVEWGELGMNALKPSFKIKGWDPQLMGMMGKRKRSPWTVYGMLVDKQREVDIEVKAVMHARLGKIGTEGFERGKALGHDHALHEVVHYELYYDGKEKYYWDFWEEEYRINGVPVNDTERRILRAPGA